MASHSYVIPELDEDVPSEAPNLFSKRAKLDSVPEHVHVEKLVDSLSSANSTVEVSRKEEEEEESRSSLDLSCPTESISSTPTPTILPSSMPSSSSLQVHSRQRGNPLLKHFRQVKWEYSDVILGGADYSMSRSSCALYLSLRYHSLNPNYIYDRLKSSKLPYQLKILLVQCDVTEPSESLKELARLCILYEFTLLLSWSDEESARFLETYRIMEGKSAENLMDGQQQQSNDYLSKLIDMLTQVSAFDESTKAYMSCV